MNKRTNRLHRATNGWFEAGKTGYIFYPVGWQGWVVSFVWLMLSISVISALTLWIKNPWLSFGLSIFVGWLLLWVFQIVIHILSRRNKHKKD